MEFKNFLNFYTYLAFTFMSWLIWTNEVWCVILQLITTMGRYKINGICMHLDSSYVLEGKKFP